VFMEIGGYISEGAAVGIDKMSGLAVKASKNLGLGVEDAFNPHLSTDGLDVSSKVNDINKQAERRLSHTLYSNINVEKQPAHINVSIGKRDFYGFVEDITEVQGRNRELRRRFT